jgi:hypothetical protein
MKKATLLFVFVLSFVFVSSFASAQESKLASDSPQVKALLHNLQALHQKTIRPMGGPGTTIGCNPFPNDGQFRYPILKTNRRSFSQGQTLQAWLQVPYFPQDQNSSSCGVWYTWYLTPVNVPEGQTAQPRAGSVDGIRLFRPGDVVQLANYTWSSELWGEYLLIYFCNNYMDGELLSMGATALTFGYGTDQNYLGIDSATFVKSITDSQGQVLVNSQVKLTGQFIPPITSPFGDVDILKQYVEFDGVLVSIKILSNTEAIIENFGASPGFYDLTFIAWNPTNNSFDSMSAPGALTIR